MKRLLAIFLAVIMILALSACDAEYSNDLNGDLAAGIENGASVGGMKGDADAPAGGDDVVGGLGGDAVIPGVEDMVPDDYFDGDMEAAEEPGGADVDADGDDVQYPSAGLLTAGEWKDVENIEFWRALLNNNEWYQLMENRDLYANNVKVVNVKDSTGAPCYNAEVKLIAGDGSVLYTAKTDVVGNAYLFYNLNNEEKTPVKARVMGKIEHQLSGDITEIRINEKTEKVQALDLMLMIDTTGSMIDELSYLQRELEDVISRVAQSSSNTLSIRVSVNFYRDKSDDYVILPFNFTDNIDEAVRSLKAQSANGGGDYPEAVHVALDNAVYQHQWREDAVKLMFFVLDAPPHTEQEINGINAQMQKAVLKAADMGIRIIPVASSGVDRETEFLLRSYAAMTGGTYVFLTNHSGIGGDHLEPTIGEYDVEPLNECLIRVISEYCGLSKRGENKDEKKEMDTDYLVSYAGWSTDKLINDTARNKDKLRDKGTAHLPIYTCRSIEQLNGFKSTYQEVFEMNSPWNEIPSFEDMTKGFDEEFFKSNALLLVYVEANTCTLRFGADSIVFTKYSVCVNVTQLNDPEECEDAMAGWLIAVPVSHDQLGNVIIYDAVMK